MSPEDFDKLIDLVLEKCKQTLVFKEKEYSEGKDRLDQFKKGSIYLGVPAHQVLAGFMLKHTTSIYDMIKEKDTTKFSMDKWDEKIGDHINYLLLLQGILEDDRQLKDLKSQVTK